MKKSILFSAFALLAVTGSSAMAGTASGSMLGNTCNGCHGPGGISEGPATPTIAGISKDYFVEAMETYRDGTRPSTIMTRIAKGYNDEEVAAMADFFSKLKYEGHGQSFNADKAAKGAKIHKKYCEKCHEDGGRSSEDDAGLLAGQWAPYLEYTMDDFRSGDREMTKKMAKKMKKLEAAHGDAGIDALINFYASDAK